MPYNDSRWGDGLSIDSKEFLIDDDPGGQSCFDLIEIEEIKIELPDENEDCDSSGEPASTSGEGTSTSTSLNMSYKAEDQMTDHRAALNHSVTSAGSHYRRLRCIYCDRVMYTPKTLANHQQKCRPVECSVCGRKIPVGTIAAHLYRHENMRQREKHVVCKQSKIQYRRITRSRSAPCVQTRMLESQGFQCEFCDKSYSSQNSLSGHIRMNHNFSRKRAYICETCGVSFCNKVKFNVHRRKHVYRQCPVCGIKVVRDYFTQHFKNHSPDTPRFRCKLCTNSYIWKGSLNRHIYLNHAIDDKSENVCEQNDDEQKRIWSCEACNRSFSSQVKLKLHQVHHKTKQCPECGVQVSIFKLKSHLKLHTSKIRSYRCDDCGQLLKTKDNLKRHLTNVHQVLHIAETKPQSTVCDHCGRDFNTVAKLKAHLLSYRTRQCHVCGLHLKYTHLRYHLMKHGSAAFNYRCELCYTWFASKNSFDTHTALKHGIGDKCSQTRSYVCQECNESFANQKQLEHHMEKHKRTPCPDCGIKISVKDLKWHLKSHATNFFRCELCQKHLKSKNSLLSHLSIKHPEVVNAKKESYSCNYCSRSFGNKYLLKMHKLAHKTRHCDVCGTDVKYTHFRYHSMKHSSAGFRFCCAMCNKLFTSQKSLNAHTAADHGKGKNLSESKLYVCEKCNESFISEASLDEHQEHHPCVQCSICGIKVAVKSVKWHLKSHQPNRFPCAFCIKSFTSKQYLKEHISLNHSAGDNQCRKESHVCDQCNKSFNSFIQLHRHERYHMRKCKN